VPRSGGTLGTATGTYADLGKITYEVGGDIDAMSFGGIAAVRLSRFRRRRWELSRLPLETERR
jgi:hypothetical protein